MDVTSEPDVEPGTPPATGSAHHVETSLAPTPSPASDPVTTDDLRASLGSWSAAAAALDERELRVTLLRSTGLEGAPVEMARDLLILGRAEEAMGVLEEAGVDKAPHSQDHLTWPELVLGAVDAACGDEEAYGWLLAQASRLNGTPDLAHVLPLVGAAADARGDVAVADDAWSTYVHVFEAKERRAVQRACVATLARRRVTWDHLLTSDVIDYAGRLTSLDPRPAEDPTTVLETADALVARGDEVAARFLLKAVDRLAPDVTPVENAADRLSRQAPDSWVVGAMLVATGSVVLPAAVAADVFFAVMLALVLPTLLVTVWQNRGGRGFTQSEYTAHRKISQLRSNPVTGSRRRSAHLSPTPGVAAAFALMASALVALPVVRMVDAWLGRPQLGWPPNGERPLLLLLGIVAVGGLVGYGVQTVRARRHLRTFSAGVAAEERHLLAEAEHCQCWNEMAMSGRRAEAYAARHLVAVAGAPAAYVHGLLGEDAGIAVCPVIGTPWLTGPLGRRGHTVALRGTQPAPRTPPEPASQGFYL